MVVVKEDMKGAARRERRLEDKRISITATFRRRLSAASLIGFRPNVLCVRATGEGVRAVLWLVPLPHSEKLANAESAQRRTENRRRDQQLPTKRESSAHYCPTGISA